MLDFFSKKDKKRIEELNLEIENLNNTIKHKNVYIEKLESELKLVMQEKEENERNFKIKQKQMEILEKNLVNMRNNNNILKEDKKILKHSALNASLPLEKHKYKIPLEKYFSSAKFREVVQSLKEEQVYFIDQLDERRLKNYEEKNEKKIIEMNKKYNEFLVGDMDLETKIYVLKGEKIGKIFSRHRKFTTYMNEKNFEYIDDIIDFDFSKLKDEGFKHEQISELVDKIQNYYDKFLIKKER